MIESNLTIKREFNDVRNEWKFQSFWIKIAKNVCFKNFDPKRRKNKKSILPSLDFVGDFNFFGSTDSSTIVFVFKFRVWLKKFHSKKKEKKSKSKSNESLKIELAIIWN